MADNFTRRKALTVVAAVPAGVALGASAALADASADAAVRELWQSYISLEFRVIEQAAQKMKRPPRPGESVRRLRGLGGLSVSDMTSSLLNQKSSGHWCEHDSIPSQTEMAFGM